MNDVPKLHFVNEIGHRCLTRFVQLSVIVFEEHFSGSFIFYRHYTKSIYAILFMVDRGLLLSTVGFGNERSHSQTVTDRVKNKRRAIELDTLGNIDSTSFFK